MKMLCKNQLSPANYSLQSTGVGRWAFDLLSKVIKLALIPVAAQSCS